MGTPKELASLNLPTSAAVKDTPVLFTHLLQHCRTILLSVEAHEDLAFGIDQDLQDVRIGDLDLRYRTPAYSPGPAPSG